MKNSDAVLFQNLYRHLRVSGGFQRGGQNNFTVAAQKGEGEHQPRDELGADVPGQGKDAGLQPAGNFQRQSAAAFAGYSVRGQAFQVNPQRSFGKPPPPGKDGRDSERRGDRNQKPQSRTGFPAVGAGRFPALRRIQRGERRTGRGKVFADRFAGGKGVRHAREKRADHRAVRRAFGNGNPNPAAEHGGSKPDQTHDRASMNRPSSARGIGCRKLSPMCLRRTRLMLSPRLFLST